MSSGRRVTLTQVSHRVFISYGGYDDQVIALRLQTLASVYGFESYVPAATTRTGSGTLSPGARQQLDLSDLVLAVVNHQPTQATVAELNHAIAQKKMVIPIVGQWVDPSFAQAFPAAFVLNPMNPAEVEQQIMTFLQQSKANKETKQMLVGLAAVAVGL